MPTSEQPVTLKSLKQAFSLAEDRIKGERNRSITKVVTNEVFSGVHEGIVNAVIARALYDTHQDCDIETEYKRIDICVSHSNRVVAAIEGKGIVADSRKSDNFIDALDVHGIRSKLKSISSDINSLEKKIPSKMRGIRFEVFVPIVFEFSRDGGEDEWFNGKKPWVTHCKYRTVRQNLKNNLRKWFRRQDKRFRLIHTTKPILLSDANELWLDQSHWRYPKFNSLEAIVSFYAFGRRVQE